MPSFPDIRFSGTLRPSQELAISIIRERLRQGETRFHIVAPPGSGKTVLGLYFWAECVGRKAVVLSPNSAIQSQWTSRLSLFDWGEEHQIGSTDPKEPAYLTSLTYQSVTMPGRGGISEELKTVQLWQEKLIEQGEAVNPREALIWINDLKAHNCDYYEERMSFYRKKVRDQKALSGDALDVLHDSAMATLERLKGHGVGMIILDECHHLMGHWGRVLDAAHDFLEGPVVLGLTATPPDTKGRLDEDIERYQNFFGPVDFEVPVPALVKDGHLAPYQDLAYFVRPATAELAFIARADAEFHELVESLCEPHNDPDRALPLPQWVFDVLDRLQLPTGRVQSWAAFEKRDRVFADEARLFLGLRELPLPEGVPPPPEADQADDPGVMSTLIPVLDRYIRHALRRSPSADDRKLAETATARLRLLGSQITETGAQACVSPVGRVLAYAGAKSEALIDILREEFDSRGDSIRAVVIADYEKTSSISAEITDLLDEEAGGAVAAFRSLLTHERTDLLDPILVTGSTVLVDDELVERFVDTCREMLKSEDIHCELTVHDEGGFSRIEGRGEDWCPRVYVRLITEIFQQGLSRCLVGTRGLLGEGWDANRINVLVDLTTVTTSMTVNQLRGRSFRLDPEDPQKVANNWDVVCVAGEFAKGLDDYHRFRRKHMGLYGVCDDGAVEKGVGHVHAAFTELKPEGIEGSMGILNSDMLARSRKLDECRSQWRIGEPFKGEAAEAVELGAGGGDGFPAVAGGRDMWSDHSLTEAIAGVVIRSLIETEQMSEAVNLSVTERSGGYVRVTLNNAEIQEQQLLMKCIQEVLGPLSNPRYVIQRFVDDLQDTWISKLLPEVIGRYFRKRSRRYAMLHMVPSCLATKKEIARIFERHWNETISPGEVQYAHRGEGAELVAEARSRGLAPVGAIHRKQVFH